MDREQALIKAFYGEFTTIEALANHIGCDVSRLLYSVSPVQSLDYHLGYGSYVNDQWYNRHWLFPQYYTLHAFWIGVADGIIEHRP